MSDGGKGSKPRPFSVSQEQFNNNFEAIFGKREKIKLKMPGTIGSAEVVFKEDNESSNSNTDNQQ